MLRSFSKRLVMLQVALVVGLLTMLTVVHAIAGFVLYAKAVERIDVEIASRVASQIDEELTEHRSLAEAARAAVPHVAQPAARILVFDEGRHLVFGVRSSRRERGEGTPPPDDHHPSPEGHEPSNADRAWRALGALVGLHGAEAAFHGGTVVVVVPSLHGYGHQMDTYLGETLPFALLGILIAVYAGRKIAAQAIAPLLDVTAGLRSLAAGDFTPRPIATASRDEIGELARAYNDAGIHVQRAFAERERAELHVRQFIADAGHELRTPLTVVMGYLDALKDGIVNDPSKAGRVYATMLGECRRMRGTIQQLIYLARLDTGDPPANAPVDLRGLVRELVATLQPLASRLELMLPPGDVAITVLGDRGELREAVSNVVDNALKYAADAPTRVALTVDDREATILVEDRGAGMSSDDVAHAFDRFHRGSDRGEIEGSGLGLAIAKRSVERMNGRIALVSAPGEGTTVRIVMPLA